MLRFALIDIDNTLLDFDAYVRETMRVGFARFGLRPYEPWMYDRFTAINNRLWRAIEQQSMDFEALQRCRWNLVFADLGIQADGPAFERYFRAALNESAIEVEGAADLLRALHGRLTLCAASNGPYDQQVHRLRLAGMDRYFDFLFISEELGVSKPAPAFAEAAFARLRAAGMEAAPEACVVIGDSQSSDMALGLACGMHTCFYRRDASAALKAPYDYVADRLCDIPALLGLA